MSTPEDDRAAKARAVQEQLDNVRPFRLAPTDDKGRDKPKVPLLHPRSMASLAGKPVPVLKFMMPQWIPWGYPVLLCGQGSAGKTTLVCQLAATLAIGDWFLGMELPHLKSLALLCEDLDEDSHRMMVRLAEQLGHDLSEFTDFEYDPRMGEDNTLIFCDRRGNIKPTPLYEELAERIGDEKRDLLVLDNSRHLITGINENDNSAVTTAWSLLHGLVRPTNGTTLLLGHTPKNNSAEWSGGASWENVARSRLYLGPVKIEVGEEIIINDPRRVLRRGKNNTTGVDEINIILEHGGFRLERPEFSSYGDQLGKEMRKGQASQVFLDALDALTAQRRHTSHSSVAQNFAPKVMCAANLASGFTKAELTQAMESLFKDGRIKAGVELWRGPDRHVVVGIGRAGMPGS